MGLSARVLSPQTARGIVGYFCYSLSPNDLQAGELFVGHGSTVSSCKSVLTRGLQIILSARDRDLLRRGAEFKIL